MFQNNEKNLPDRIYICGECKFSFYSRGEYDEHNHGETPRNIKCAECKDKFNKITDLQDHAINKHKKEPPKEKEAITKENLFLNVLAYQVDSLMTNFQVALAQLEDIKKELKSTENKCGSQENVSKKDSQNTKIQKLIETIDGKIYKLEKEMKENKMKNVEQQENKHTIYRCEICNHAAKNKQELSNHKKKEHKVKHTIKYNCHECDFETESRETIQDHKKEAHMSVDISKSDVIYKCEECDFEISKRMDMKNHKRNKHNSSVYQCDECPFRDGDKSKMDNHKSSIHNQSPNSIPCQECDFVANSEDTLSKHMQVAMGHKVKRLCRYFINGSCKFESSCKFLHSTENVRNSRKSQQIGESKRQCKFYGKCSKFPNCGYAHKEICRFQENCTKRQCEFVHLAGYFLEQWRLNMASM